MLSFAPNQYRRSPCRFVSPVTHSHLEFPICGAIKRSLCSTVLNSDDNLTRLYRTMRITSLERPFFCLRSDCELRSPRQPWCLHFLVLTILAKARNSGELAYHCILTNQILGRLRISCLSSNTRVPTPFLGSWRVFPWQLLNNDQVNCVVNVDCEGGRCDCVIG